MIAAGAPAPVPLVTLPELVAVAWPPCPKNPPGPLGEAGGGGPVAGVGGPRLAALPKQPPGAVGGGRGGVGRGGGPFPAGGGRGFPPPPPPRGRRGLSRRCRRASSLPWRCRPRRRCPR